MLTEENPPVSGLFNVDRSTPARFVIRDHGVEGRVLLDSLPESLELRSLVERCAGLADVNKPLDDLVAVLLGEREDLRLLLTRGILLHIR